MLSKIRADRRLVKLQRLKVMLTGFLAGGAAGVKLGNGFLDREASNWKILKSAGRDRWDFFPRRCVGIQSFTIRPVDRVARVLKCKHLQRQLIKVVRPAVKEGVDALLEVNCQGISR